MVKRVVTSIMTVAVLMGSLVACSGSDGELAELREELEDVKEQLKESESAQDQTPTPIPTLTPEPTPTPEPAPTPEPTPTPFEGAPLVSEITFNPNPAIFVQPPGVGMIPSANTVISFRVQSSSPIDSVSMTWKGCIGLQFMVRISGQHSGNPNDYIVQRASGSETDGIYRSGLSHTGFYFGLGDCEFSLKNGLISACDTNGLCSNTYQFEDPIFVISENGASEAAPPSPTATPVPSQTYPAPTSEPEPTSTVSQRQAAGRAQDYLNYSYFSRSGLIDQLEYEGFSTADATYGVDAQNADWNAQAAGSAQDYLNYSYFSRSGLIDQLVYEGFTLEQATYGVDAQNADWNAQAAGSAQDYLNYSSFSRSGLIDQLIYEGFTLEQATYGVNAVGL